MAYIAGIVLIGLKVGDETIGTLYHTHVYKNINCTQSLDRPTEPWWCKALYDMQFGKFFFLFNCFLKKYNWTDNSVHDFKKSQSGQTVSWKKSVELRKYGGKLTLNLEVKNAWSKIQIFFCMDGWDFWPGKCRAVEPELVSRSLIGSAIRNFNNFNVYY